MMETNLHSKKKYLRLCAFVCLYFTGSHGSTHPGTLQMNTVIACQTNWFAYFDFESIKFKCSNDGIRTCLTAGVKVLKGF